MRNYIDIVSGKKSSLKDHKSILSILEEGIKENMEMLNSLRGVAERYKLDGVMGYVKSIEDVMRDLKRNDRQVYAAKWCRLWVFQQLVGLLKQDFYRQTKLSFDPDSQKDEFNNVYEQFHSEVSKLAAKYTNDWQKTVGDTGGFDKLPDSMPMATLRREIVNHFMGIEYVKIKNYTFTQKPYLEIIADLDALEDEYKTKVGGLLTLQAGDKIILKLPDNYMWVMLSRGYCRDEAGAMGHCGNAGAKSGDRILSLRKFEERIDGTDYYSVYLTFILNADGKLGEMKGRANNKPVARYHPAIIELLKLPIIKGIRGGGYLPENNFSLNDLTEDQQNELLELKPELGGLLFRYQKQGDTPEIRKEILDTLKEEHYQNKSTFDDEGNLIFTKFDNLTDMIEELSDDDLTNKILKNEIDFYPDYTNPDAINGLLDELTLQRQIKIIDYVQDLVESNGDEDEIEDFDPTDSENVMKYLQQYDDTAYGEFQSAISIGEQYGAESEAFEALESAIKSAQQQIEHGSLVIPTYTRSNGDTGFVFDSPCYIKLTIEEACKLLDEDSSKVDDYGGGTDLSDIKETFWGDLDSEIFEVSEPYYGFSGYDREAAIDHLLENLDIEGLDDVEKAPGEMPDFMNMSKDDLKEFIEMMYEKIPDGFIRKAPLLTVEEWRWPNIARNLWIKWYGKPTS